MLQAARTISDCFPPAADLEISETRLDHRCLLAMERTRSVGGAAHRANMALTPFEFLIGEWRTTGTHRMVPGKALSGRTSFSWHKGGAFLVMRTEVDEPGFPDGVAIGSDKLGKRAFSRLAKA
jgi:hypothetical protein